MLGVGSLARVINRCEEHTYCCCRLDAGCCGCWLYFTYYMYVLAYSTRNSVGVDVMIGMERIGLVLDVGCWTAVVLGIGYTSSVGYTAV